MYSGDSRWMEIERSISSGLLPYGALTAQEGGMRRKQCGKEMGKS